MKIRFFTVAPLAFACSMALLLPISAGAVLIDFDDAPFPGTNEIVTSTISDGFTFTSTTSTHHHEINNPPAGGPSGVAANGTQYILEEGGSLGGPITMAPSGGGTFSLGSFDGAEVFIGNNVSGFPNATVINVVGNLFGGGTVGATFSLDGILDGLGGVADFQSFVLPGTFTSLISVVFSGSIAGGSTNAGISIDNLNTASVPEPGSLALLAPMLFGMAFWRRKVAS